MKIRISYQKPQELYIVMKLLQPIIKSCKVGKGGNEPYRKAYIECEIVQKNIEMPFR